MGTVFVHVDRLLRGEFTKSEALRLGRIEIPASTLVKLDLVLGAIYGACMAVFPAIRNRPDGLYQIPSSMVKVPLLFLLTLVVTVPSLYVFSALANSRLRFGATLRLLLVAISVNLAVLASLAPVTAFFALCTKSHAFMQVLNAFFFTISGLVGLVFLHKALRNALVQDAPPAVAPPVVGSAAVSGSADAIGVAVAESRTRAIFYLWCITYGIVGAQMAWILRPFLGAPGLEFQIFRGRESNVFRGIADAIHWALQT